MLEKAFALQPHLDFLSFKPILAFHEHYPSVQYILGDYPDAETAREQLAVDNNYAQTLAQAGYLVCAIEQRGFGERKTRDTSGDPSRRTRLSPSTQSGLVLKMAAMRFFFRSPRQTVRL